MTDAPLLSVRDLRKEFVTGRGGLARHRRSILAVDDISFDVAPGEVLGLVGESGCGKTTTGRLILRLVEPTSGHIRYRDRDLLALSPAEMRTMRKELQIIFQDPFGALNPRMTAGELVIEPLVVHGVGDSASRETRLREVLDLVGFSSWHAGRYPHEFSGGQRQRLCIARALVLNPSLVICDEAVSALDVSVQAQILNLLQDLRSELGLTYLFISHDLGVVHHISDRVAVMYLGQIVEIADKKSLFDAPAHPYTQALLDSVPSAQKGRKSFFTIPGDVPSAANPPPGCRFHTRCPMAQDRCKTDAPRLRPLSDGRLVSCHFAETSQANHVRSVG
ncbi:ABC transporter ATP-binding protein [Tropicimonas sp. IMCC6043]|uniref:ABC transporter ATP-binding protein n=1 Tax=Tropicimonas sp. IMCC6043 TaxID=2510645 RepID=UPI00101C3960|nr:oligopeptide/dipeptide ABC transporter ATP-binding protein [Tropicimonas sp. IMCC6043]RYH07833.1 ATP-binding cassette domain-containing protein [Tropicimonas sp. IMCC6043]